MIHADRIWYKVNRKTPLAEPITEEEKEGEMRDCLVAFSCVERFDETEPQKLVTSIQIEIRKTLDSLKISKVIIFPFAHLSQSLSSPNVALDILKDVEKSLRKTGLDVKRVPFGWNKKFKLESKGHPMAVLSKAICPIMDKCKVRCPHCDWPLPESIK